MLSLEKILEITILAISFFLLGLIVQKFLTKKEKEDYKQNYKEMIENFVSLNVTHLHDSANLFNLIKMDLLNKILLILQQAQLIISDQFLIHLKNL